MTVLAQIEQLVDQHPKDAMVAVDVALLEQLAAKIRRGEAAIALLNANGRIADVCQEIAR